MRVRIGWTWMLTLLCCYLLDYGLASTSSLASPTPAPGSTPSPGATPSPTNNTPAPTTSSDSSSSSSSGTSRGTVVAWALFTVLVGVGLLVFLYNQEQDKRWRIHHGESIRQSLASSDAMQQVPFRQQQEQEQQPVPTSAPSTMSSF